MPAALLDTHALYWLVSGVDDLAEAALVSIGENQASRTLYVSPITAWELSVATQKTPGPGRPDLGEGPPERGSAKPSTGARLIPVKQRIALEAADVATVYIRKDPGDCFLIATARLRRIPIITRDGAMCDLARDQPDYLSVITC